MATAAMDYLNNIKNGHVQTGVMEATESSKQVTLDFVPKKFAFYSKDNSGMICFGIYDVEQGFNTSAYRESSSSTFFNYTNGVTVNGRVVTISNTVYGSPAASTPFYYIAVA